MPKALAVKTKFVVSIVGVIVALFMLASSALAMSSANYRMDWFTPLTGGGGGSASSTNYAVNLTIGQTIIGTASSTNYGVGLGYWYGADVCWHCLYLPLIIR